MQGLKGEALRAKALETQLLELTRLLPRDEAQQNEPSGPTKEPHASSSADDIRQARQEAMDAQVAIAVADEELRQAREIRASGSADDIPQARQMHAMPSLHWHSVMGKCNLEMSLVRTAMGKPHPKTEIQVTLLAPQWVRKVSHPRPRPPLALQESHHCSCCGMAEPSEVQREMIFLVHF